MLDFVRSAIAISVRCFERVELAGRIHDVDVGVGRELTVHVGAVRHQAAAPGRAISRISFRLYFISLS